MTLLSELGDLGKDVETKLTTSWEKSDCIGQGDRESPGQYREAALVRQQQHSSQFLEGEDPSEDPGYPQVQTQKVAS